MGPLNNLRLGIHRLGLVVGVALWCLAPAVQSAGLPVPCAGGSCGAGPSAWLSSGVATAVTNPAGTRLDVNQATDKALYNWAEFNIDAGNTVNFNQPGKSSLALNRIFQGDPSKIFGTLSANGQVYLINQNGIVFGRGSQVNVAGLVASSLDIDEEAVSGGILNPNLLIGSKAAFASATNAEGEPLAGDVIVEEGATLQADPAGGGRIALFGREVANAGRIEARSGQVILASGTKVYLQASSDPKLRGLLVEVDGGGKTWNQLAGEIATTQGNTTLVGLAVNQDGRISATTSVRANGSIRLLARDTVSVSGGASPVIATARAGSVALGAGSTVEVAPDTADTTTAVEEQKQAPSRVEIVGRQVSMAAGSTIRARGGQVSLTAVTNPSVPQRTESAPFPVDPESRIRLAAGSLIDVSGSTATTSVARNSVEVELRSNELRDSPLQRDGALRGQKVRVDARIGTPLADVSSAVAVIPKDISERTATGGSVAFASQGDVVLAEGATVDVSGGKVVYAGGVVPTSTLITADGRAVDIGKASPDQVYRAVVNGTADKVYNKWGVVETRQSALNGVYDPGYTEGRDAGTVSFAAPGLVIDGNLLGNVTNGLLQRDSSDRALGGRLIVGVPDGQGLPIPDYRAPSISFVRTAVPVIVAPDAPLPGAVTQLELSTRYLTEGGFTRTELFSNGVISVGPDTPLDLAAGSTLDLRAAVVELGANVRAPGGTIRATAVQIDNDARLEPDRKAGVTVADAVTLDVAGDWVNDNPALAGSGDLRPLFLNGGSVDLSVRALNSELVIGDDVTINADAGAQRTAAGEFESGSAGQVALQARGAGALVAIGRDLKLSAFGFDRGGSLTLAANQVRVVEGAGIASQTSDPLAALPAPFTVGAGTFQSGGFGAFRMVGTGERLTDADGDAIEPLELAPGTEVRAGQLLRTFGPAASTAQSGTRLDQFTSVGLPPDYLRPATSLSLAVEPHSQVTAATVGDLVLGTGSRISMDTGGTVNLAAPGRIRLDGEILAPAGQISARLATPGGAVEIGANPGVGIFVGSTARLSAAGVATLEPDELGVRRGVVADGGAITLNAERGAVELRAGSLLDVSGAAAELDVLTGGSSSGPLPTVARRVVASRGGAISLTAPESLLLAGDLRGFSGGSGPQRPEGGTLSVAISRRSGFSPGTDVPNPFDTSSRQLWVTAEAAPDGGDPAGVARFDPAIVARGGFDNLTLRADNQDALSAAPDDAIVFAEDTTLAVSNALRLQAPNLIARQGVSAITLSANYLSLGPAIESPPAPGAASGGGATLTAIAGLIDVRGGLALQGIGSTRLESRSDLRFIGLASGQGQGLRGSLSAAGALTLQANQLYPTTYSRFSIDVAPEAGGRLEILPGAGAATPVLSGAGELTFRAATIEHSGTLRAPLGRITLAATDTLKLADGSLTSTAAEGQSILFGRVVAGTDWLYQPVLGSTQIFDPIAAPPEAALELKGDQVVVAAGAKVDVSGGGDLYAYEFIPGPGGSVDALSTQQNPNLFALLPARAATLAPYDTQEYQGSSLRPGDSVYLEGVQGLLAAGEYALMPARYALLPGAVLVEAVDGTIDFPAGGSAALPDGSAVVAGYRTVAGTGLRDSRTIGFAVRPGSYARELAEYRDSFASKFFAARAASQDLARPFLSTDAGALRILVGEALELDGTLLSAPATDGRGARVDLSASQLRIVAASGEGTAGVVEVEASRLASLGATSLLIGGTRASSGGITDISPSAATVTLAEGVVLDLPEVVLVARDEVSLEANSSLRASGAAVSGAAREQLRLNAAGDGGGALLRVSRNGPADVIRPTSAAQSGNIGIAAGATVMAQGSVAVEAGGIARSFGGIDAGGGALSLGSGRIVLGADQTDVADGLALSNETLRGLVALRELQLKAGTGIDFRNSVSLGAIGARPERLVVDAPILLGSGSDATLAAGTVVLRNSGATNGSVLTAGTGTLVLGGDEVRLEGGTVSTGNFARTVAQGVNRVTADGSFELVSGNDVEISTALLTGTPGSSLAIRAPGRQVALLRTVATTELAGGIGAALAIDADRIDVATSLAYRAGQIRLTAEQDLRLLAGADLDARGQRVTLLRSDVVLPAGDIALVARTGGVTLDGAARVDVSAADPLGTSGSVSVFAAGNADLAGGLFGGAATGTQSGVFRLYAGALGDFAGLNGVLNAGGFARRREIETGAGDLLVGAGTTVRANEVVLAASGGAVTVSGTVDSSTAGGGRIVLAARDDVTLAAGGSLDADSTSAPGAADAGQGGEVSLFSRDGQIRVQAGSAISVAAAENDPDSTRPGTLLLRAQANGNDLNVAELAPVYAGVGRLILEPVLSRAVGPTIDAAAIAGFRTALDDYMAAAPDVIRSRLGLDSSRDAIRPGLELVGSGDVALAAEWNMQGWRFPDEPGFLTIRSAGQLVLNNNLSDAFSGSGTLASPLGLSPGDSWSFRLVGGAATTSALPWATAGRQITSLTSGGVTLANNRVIRTGTGSVLVAADADIQLANGGSLIYTAGERAIPPEPEADPEAPYLTSAAYLKNGGDITLAAGRDISAVAPTQIMSGWNVRSGSPGGGTDWAINIGQFRQGVSAMAGGTVQVSAGRDIVNLAASVLTTGAERADGSGIRDSWGGGNLEVAAGRDVAGGVYSTWRGDGLLKAGGNLSAGAGSRHPVLAFGEGRVDVQARRNAVIEGVINPSTTGRPLPNDSTFFYSYLPTDSLVVRAAGGDIRLVNSPSAFSAIVGNPVASQTSTYGVLPASFQAFAPSGGIELNGNLRLLPGSRGQLELAAADSVELTAGTTLTMSDANTDSVPVATRPSLRDGLVKIFEASERAAIHVGDSVPVRIIARDGNISGGVINLAKYFYAAAGRDVRNISLVGQNTDGQQTSVVSAGRDLVLADRSNEITLGGPGRLAVFAVRNIDLGFSGGITTIGRTSNPALSGPAGAGIDLWTGLGSEPAYAAFNARYWDQQYASDLTRFTSGDDKTPALINYVEQASGQSGLTADSVWVAYAALPTEKRVDYLAGLSPADQIAFPSFEGLVDRLVTYTASVTGDTALAASTAADAFLALDSEQQRPLVEDMLFRELRDSGREANLPGDFGFTRGEAAVQALFPDDGAFSGDLSLVFSRIYTLDGGDVNLLVPGGLLNVGLATLPANLGFDKSASQLGIVTQGEGAVRIFTDGDVLVNQSRVFTLQGGDIVIWSSNGDIDAGRGSKSAISAPPPRITVSSTGEIIVEFSDAIAGSGIRGILTNEDVAPGDVDLIAPTGEVNAGDAGIGSAGNLNIAAPRVVGLDNIQVAGISTGVPADSGIAASLTGVSSLSSGVAKGAAESAGDSADGAGSLAEAALGWLEVFIEGFGEEDEDDEEERRRRGQ